MLESQNKGENVEIMSFATSVESMSQSTTHIL